MDETIVTAPDAVVVTNESEPVDATHPEPAPDVDESSDSEISHDQAESSTGPDANLFRQQICETFPGIRAGDLPGETFDEVFAALPGALENTRQAPTTSQPDSIPAGPTSRSAVIDLESLSPESKIRAGLMR